MIGCYRYHHEDICYTDKCGITINNHFNNLITKQGITIEIFQMNFHRTDSGEDHGKTKDQEMSIDPDTQNKF